MAEIRNPNASGGGSENKLLLYAMLAMVVVFAASQLYRSHKTAPLQKPTATAPVQMLLLPRPLLRPPAAPPPSMRRLCSIPPRQWWSGRRKTP